MVKKTFYTKEELEKQKIDSESKQMAEKEAPQKKNLIVEKVETEIKQELDTDSIVKKAPKKIVVKKRRARPSLMDENGNKLKQDGTIDKRSETGIQNLQKSRVYQKILENKKLKETVAKVAVLTPYADTSDSETEFDIENTKLEIEPEAVAAPAVRGAGTEDFIRKQEAEREKMLADQLKSIELENKKLKDSFHYNSHLNRMQVLSTNVKLKF